MSSLDGTTPQTYEQELEDHYDLLRFVNLAVSEKEALQLLSQRMKDLQELPHNSDTAKKVFDLVGQTRKALDEMEERARKRITAAEKRKKAPAKTKAKTKVKPSAKAKPRKRKTTTGKAMAPPDTLVEAVAK